jgi:hypothetical protein
MPIDSASRTKFRHEIINWGTSNSSKERAGGRKDYGAVRYFMFAALLAKTDIDWLALDKGELPVSRAAGLLLKKMEEYGNFGLQYLHEKLMDSPELFRREAAFFDIFNEIHQELHKDETKEEVETALEPDPL